VVAASSSDRMMVTTGTDAKRRQGKGEEGMYAGGPRQPTRGKMKLRWVREAEPLCCDRPRFMAPKSGSFAV
jgi:hypothetical protein